MAGEEDVLYTHRNVEGRRRKKVQHSYDGDRDKPSSHQTRGLYSVVGGRRLAISKLPVDGDLESFWEGFSAFFHGKRMSRLDVLHLTGRGKPPRGYYCVQMLQENPAIKT